MNASVLHFVPFDEKQPHENLLEFVKICKQSNVLSAFSQWNSNIWDVGHQKGKNGMLRAAFSTLEASKKGWTEPVFPDPYLDYAKAILVYLQDRRPVVSVGPRITALRCLEVALRQWNKDSRPTAVTVEILDTAVDLARNSYSADVAYRVAGQLELISDLLHTHAIVRLRYKWAHGLKKPDALGSRISKESMDAREQKLPSATLLRALGNFFIDATSSLDVLVASYTAIMLCAPERINEVLRLRRNCLVEGDKDYAGILGLRWPGSKGADNTVKWLPTQMVDVARKAIDNLIRVTRPAQEIATWYTQSPHSIFFHKDADHLKGKEVLSLEELALLLWGNSNMSDSANAWGKKKGSELPVIKLDGKKIGYRLKDVERLVLDMLPSTFPYVPGAPDLLCKDALGVLRLNESHDNRGTYLCMFSCVDNQVVTKHYGGRKDLKSLFSRFDYKEDDGSPMVLNSHSLRHYLNMLAHRGGLSSAEIAIFSGRKDQFQNGSYDHRTSDEVQLPIMKAFDVGFTSGLVVPTARELISRKEFNGLGLVTGHTTEFGWCSHNFASEPCQMYRDCINCEEQVCIKGESHKEDNLRLLEQETARLLEMAKTALSEEEYGADNRVKHQTKTLDRIQKMLQIIDDPKVEDGAKFRLDVSNAALINSKSWHPVQLMQRLENSVAKRPS